MLSYRFILASLLLWIYIWFNKDKIKWKISSKSEMWIYLLLGFIYFLVTNLYFLAIQKISVSLHVVIFYTYPFIVTILAIAFLKERLSRKSAISLIIAFIGVLIMIFNGESVFSLLGMTVSFGSAIFFSIYLTILGVKKMKNINSIVIAAYTNSVTGVLFLLTTIIRGEVIFSFNLDIWLRFLFLAIISTVVAIVALSKAVQLIGPAKVAILSTFEPVEGIILSVVFLGEVLLLNQILGTILVLSAIIFMSSGDKEEFKRVKL